ncbi:serine/threonine-protein kinase [Rubinisphaera sp.]|uniref:serine/threonine protein kinase n=1 Tax=Rubinisphaera sp. TaxID=2024857 RepID=UPI000C10AA34|nr:serine/threonine-protein kinase [Rubinisphaera sp.]MBV09896.1 hypothetical protein [Rubinisphaera sp.]HCS50515.1 hypothetical protein [Planctomycetaceae bacterium]|tara:strand:+ start:1341 stop:3644 length:2304 start_codon:yes stop_codon:yes gene_type:complete
MANSEDNTILENDGSAPEQICDLFESELRSGNRPEIEQFLLSTKIPERTTLLTRLVMIELRHRLLNGETPDLDEYYRRFPHDAKIIEKLSPYYRRIVEEIQQATSQTIIPPIPQGILGRYQLFGVLGSGSFGQVWHAWDPILKRSVAIKYFDPAKIRDQKIDYARHEAEIAAQLSHPNIVKTYDVVQDETGLYLILEYIDGFDLKTSLKNGQLGISQVIEICKTLAEALHYAHEQDVIHRDIKPSNILIDLRGTPHITDFGIATWVNAEATLTADKQVIGTATHMAPEQAQGKKVTPESDVYSLGLILYEMLTGELPFKGSVRELLFAHQFRDPKSPRSFDSKISRDLETVCLKALQKKRRDRYLSALEFAEDLQRCLKGVPVKARRVTRYEKFWRWIKQNPNLGATYGVTGVALAIACAMPVYFNQTVEDGTFQVQISTNPELGNCNLIAHRIDPLTGYPDKNETTSYLPQGRNPYRFQLKPGPYIIYAKSDQIFTEAQRFLPEQINTMPYSGSFLSFKQIEVDTIKWKPIFVSENLCADEMILIPGTKQFEFGIEGNQETPLHTHSVNSFYIQAEEYSIGDFRKITTSTPDYQKSETNQDTPLVATFSQAIGFAQESGGRLPTEYEFEYVARLFQMVQQNELEMIERIAAENDLKPAELINRLNRIQNIDDGPAEWVTGSVNAYRINAGTFETERSRNASSSSSFPIPNDNGRRILKGGIVSGTDEEVDIINTVKVKPENRTTLGYSEHQSGTSFRLAQSYSVDQ